VLTLRDVHKTFFHHGIPIEVLKGVSITVEPIETIAITGASGVGKSTLLHVMGSLEPPTRGQVQFEGANLYDIAQERLSDYRNKKIGFVFQFHHLLAELTAEENTMMPALIARYSRDKAQLMARTILEKVGLEKRLSHRAGELSGGEQQRVAIARALVMGPRLLLADEPTGSLDWGTGRGIAELLLRLNREEKVALIIATHNEKLAAQLSRKMEIVDGLIR
jgi:lipoprotein-releasing system ATP-binding protein